MAISQMKCSARVVRTALGASALSLSLLTVNVTYAQVVAPGAAPVSAAAPGASVAPNFTAVGPQASSRVYIAVGDPNVKKVLMAIENTTGFGPVKEFADTLQADMDYTDLFEFLPASKLPARKGDLEAYKVLGVEFLLQSSVAVQGGQTVAELRLTDINKGAQILGRRYPLLAKSRQPGRDLAHYAGNDIVQSLTGEPGIFRTQILMSCGNRTKEIWVMDFDGYNAHQVTRDGNFALSPSWSPDGRRILFTSYRPAVKGGPLNPNLYMMNLATGNRELLSAARGLNTGGKFHPREEKIAYTFSQKGRPEIYVLDVLAKTRKAITKTQFFTVEPDWSPDGSHLTYSSSQTGRPHIYVANADGSSAQRLTFAGVYNSSPRYSPKGDKIVFAGQENMRNNFNIFSIDPAGSNLVRLTEGASSSENPVFSADARHVAFSSNQGGHYRIQVMTALGNRIRPLSPPGIGQCKQPAWSPRL